jgi:Zn-dependent M28 family amino/carboxypeptidase
MLTAKQHGAAGMLLIANPATYKLLQPFVYWPSLYRSGKKIPPAFRVDLPKAGEEPIPVMNIGGDVAQALLGGASINHLADLVRTIDSTGRPASEALPGSIEFQADINREYTPVRNVIGMVRGSRLPDEYVIIGAHYDHVGHSSPGRSAPKDERDSIYNGADDNASGTAGLLLDAEAFGGLAPDRRPARSVIFIAFSGEEKGLYGSRAYVANPSVPNSEVVAMLNMDMIGRNNPDSVSVAGRSRSPQLADVMEQANAVEPMRVAYNLEEMFFRSDQASFAAEKIPVLFFSSGEHADYHQVSDSPDKIDNTKLAHIARLCFRTAWMVADMEERPAYVEVPVRDPNAILLDQ